MKITTMIIQAGKTATGVEVPAEIVAGLGTSKKPPVRVTINGYTYRSTIATMGGKFMLPVSAEVRANAGIAGGDTVEVEIELDDQPREVEVPKDLSEALNINKAAGEFFGGLSYSNKRRIVLAIEGAKTAETRERRIVKSVELLASGKI